MPNVKDLSPEALKLFDIILDEFRKQVMPTWELEEFRSAMVVLIDAGAAKIVDHGDRFEIVLPQEFRGDFGMVQ